MHKATDRKKRLWWHEEKNTGVPQLRCGAPLSSASGGATESGNMALKNSTLFERSELRRILAIFPDSGGEAARSLDFLCLLSCIKTRK